MQRSEKPGASPLLGQTTIVSESTIGSQSGGNNLSSSSAVPLNTARRFAHIDAMRAVAVMIVVLAHAGLGFVVPGGSGVTIFFSISGFIITYLLLRERDRTGGFSIAGFYTRRLLKIGPPLVVAVIIPTLIVSIFTPIDWRGFLGQIFFYFNWFKAHHASDVLNGTGVVWSLSIEEQFYIAFALFWLAAVRYHHWRLVTAAVAAAGVLWSTIARLILAADPDNTARIYYGSETRLDGIALGVLVALAYHLWQERGSRQSRIVSALGTDWALIAAIFVYAAGVLIRDDWFRDTFRYTFQSIAACAVIVYGLMPGGGPLRRPFIAISQWRPVELIGLASYSIYLAHLSIIIVIRPLMTLPLVAEVSIAGTIGTLVGIALYKFVEVPLHAANKRSTERAAEKSPAPSSTVQASRTRTKKPTQIG
jgi:peptidoglycan/LPS O-acetylase OafA/YrhL